MPWLLRRRTTVSPLAPLKLGKSGQVSIPRAILRRLGIEGEQTFLVEASADGAIILRQAGVYPLEVYSDGRVREFDEADRPTPKETARWRRRLKGRR
jgi:bifunctional DNA-binding transcriptional regulator/antitoxin component of YhaV-PrlF toxin-antitoxin module